MTQKYTAVRMAALGGLGVAALVLTGCAATEPGGTSDAPVSITYLHRLPDGEGMTPVADIVAEWNAAHPDIQVTATKFDGKGTEMALKLENDVKAGTAPCLAQVGYSEVPGMYVKGLLEDVAAEAKTYQGDFSAGAFGMMKVGDAVVGLPQDTGPLVYYYNKAAFDALGLTAPTTAEELSADAAVASAAGKYVAAFTPDEALNWLSAQAAGAGDTWFGAKDDQWTVDADGAGSQKVAAFWQPLLDAKQVFIGERWGDGFGQALNSGQLIGHIGAAWEAGFMLDSLDGTEQEGQWRVTQLPRFGSEAMTGPDGGSGVAVMKGCAHPAEAMEFNDWFNTQVDGLASQGLVVAANGTPKTSEKMLRQFGGQDVLAELAKATGDLNPAFPYMPGFASLTKMNEVAANAAAGTATVADVFSTAQSSAVDTLESLGLPVASN